MGNSNAARAAQLGMPFGTAQQRLRKMIMFKYVVLAGHDECFKCGRRIENIEELSIEHKLPWQGRDAELFWDLNNIAFSHLRCNLPDYGSYRIKNHGRTLYEEGCRCGVCTAANTLHVQEQRASFAKRPKASVLHTDIS